MKSKSRNQWPVQSWTVTNPDRPEECFRLITKEGIRIRSKDSIDPELEPKQGELLADANYLLCINTSGQQVERTGERLMLFFYNIFGTTFIPWVLARCTIIRL